MAQAPSLRARALRALARREHSRAELEAKLRSHAADADELRDVLDDFEKRGWLSEARFVEQVTTVRRRKFGAGRILHELQEKGVSGQAVEAARDQLRVGEIQAARAVWKKKFGRLPSDLQERAKQSRFLAGRGFSAETVRAVLKGPDEDQ